MVVSGYISRVYYNWGAGAKTTKLWRADVENGVTVTYIGELEKSHYILAATDDHVIFKSDDYDPSTVDYVSVYDVRSKTLHTVLEITGRHPPLLKAARDPKTGDLFFTDYTYENSDPRNIIIRKLANLAGITAHVSVAECPIVATLVYGNSQRVDKLYFKEGVLYVVVSRHPNIHTYRVSNGVFEAVTPPPPAYVPPVPPPYGGYNGQVELYNPDTGYGVVIYPRDATHTVLTYTDAVQEAIPGFPSYDDTYAEVVPIPNDVVGRYGFWTNLYNVRQTTDVVIEFIQLSSVIAEDFAEAKIAIRVDGGGVGGTTGDDTADMSLGIRARGQSDFSARLSPPDGGSAPSVPGAPSAPGAPGTPPGFDACIAALHMQQDSVLDAYIASDMPSLRFGVSVSAVSTSSTDTAPPDIADMRIGIRIPAVPSPPWPPVTGFRMYLGALHMRSWAGVPYEMTREKIEFHDASTTDQSIDTRSTVSLEAYARGRVRASVPMKTQVLFDDRLDGVYAELAESNLALDDVLLGDLLTTVYDRLLLTGQASSAAEARALVSSALALLAVADITPAETPTDQVTLSTAAREAVLLGGETFDRLVLRDLLPHSLVLAAAVRDTAHMDDEAALRAEISQRLTDGLGLVTHLHLDDGNYTAWAMNTDSRASVRYQNYGFNSFMRVGGREYGASDAGLYRLDGDSDDGAPIKSHIRLGMSSLGSRLVKHIPDVYLGYSSSGDLLLKAVVSDTATGKREANVYRLVARGAASTREGRVKLGRGLNAVYWDFVIENVDGADFALDTIEFMPLAINRRLRGNAGAR